MSLKIFEIPHLKILLKIYTITSSKSDAFPITPNASPPAESADHFHPTNSETCKFCRLHMHTVLPYILIKRIAINRVKSELLAASFSD